MTQEQYNRLKSLIVLYNLPWLFDSISGTLHIWADRPTLVNIVSMMQDLGIKYDTVANKYVSRIQ